jgi:hypothetical protein
MEPLITKEAAWVEKAFAPFCGGLFYTNLSPRWTPPTQEVRAGGVRWLVKATLLICLCLTMSQTVSDGPAVVPRRIPRPSLTHTPPC